MLNCWGLNFMGCVYLGSCGRRGRKRPNLYMRRGIVLKLPEWSREYGSEKRAGITVRSISTWTWIWSCTFVTVSFPPFFQHYRIIFLRLSWEGKGRDLVVFFVLSLPTVYLITWPETTSLRVARNLRTWPSLGILRAPFPTTTPLRWQLKVLTERLMRYFRLLEEFKRVLVDLTVQNRP